MFRDKTVLITGASSGIGRALARRFARAGARLVLVARRSDRLEALAKEAKADGGEAFIVVADLVEPGACERVVSEAKRTAGCVDVLINNAGAGEYGRFVEQDLESLDTMMRLNMTALVRLTHLVLPEMVERRTGHVVNIASTAAFQPTPYMSVYGATKAFVLSLSMSVWEEVRRRGVRVTCIAPGPVKTEFFDRGGYESRKATFTLTALDADWLADAAYKKLIQGVPTYVPGLTNKLGALLQRFVPLRVVTRFSGRLLRPQSH
ncbi:MAG: SDR family oxidoreductase [Phycisphaerae bacterium]|nr:SDR family oxidoreductase [Phycisphaerae bacterium]